jgi:hypothetical protein
MLNFSMIIIFLCNKVIYKYKHYKDFNILIHHFYKKYVQYCTHSYLLNHLLIHLST